MKKIFMSTNEGKISVWKAAIPERENIFTIFHHISVQVEKLRDAKTFLFFYFNSKNFLFSCFLLALRLNLNKIEDCKYKKKITKKNEIFTFPVCFVVALRFGAHSKFKEQIT